MTPALLLTASVWAADLGTLARNFDRFPEDYATAIALGQGALAEGDAEYAVEAFQRAVSLSDGNYESREGLVLAYTLAGNHTAAVAEGNTLIADHPDLPGAWATRAWAWRWNPTLPQRSAFVAARSYQHALQLGGPESFRCGEAWSRWGLGDHQGAYRRFSATNAPCREAGLRATAPTWTPYGAVMAGGSMFTDHEWRTTNNAIGAQVGVRRSTAFGMDATVRRVGVHGETAIIDATAPPDAPTFTSAITAQQTEFWLRGHARAGWVGVEGLFGSATTSGDFDASARVVGGRARAQLSAVTLGASGLATAYNDGAHTQLGLDLDLPLHPRVALSGGVQLTSFVASTDDSVDDQGTMGWGAVRWASESGRVTGQVGLRLGREVRPVRIADPSIWNIDEALVGSGFASLGWRIDDRFTLFSGAEVVRLAPQLDSTSVTPTGSTVTAGHVGLRVDFGPKPGEDQ